MTFAGGLLLQSVGASLLLAVRGTPRPWPSIWTTRRAKRVAHAATPLGAYVLRKSTSRAP